ncbi:hypothetical protein [Caproiciproducens sp. MSJ-32]|uniref:hypothetical protein n=1 Tax=Caproiciproducens sp. MSJ-32 TaxID=2841527 RepID=UPI001C11A8F9|nr:hypothetical protein [Caproiciproducens sp. MSJ-32]
MRKPSIFSREYERKMRARRKRIIMISALILLVLIVVVSKSLVSNINFASLKDKIQAWVDSEDNISAKEENLAEENITEETAEEVEEEKVEEKIIELKVNETDTLVLGYEELNGVKKFKEIKENKAKLTYSINPSRTAVITIDKNQDMKIFKTDKTEVLIHAPNYVAPNGEVFEKNTVLKTYENYIWNVDAKFISDTKAAYISNVPYFGYDLNKYIWIVDLDSKTHQTLWNSKGKEVKLNKLTDKGLEVLIDGNVKYVNQNGQLVN